MIAATEFDFEPKVWEDVIGQSHIVRRLQRLAERPKQTCVLLEGRQGLGKTAIAKIFAHSMGAVDELSGYWWLCGDDPKADFESMFRNKLIYRYRPGGFNVLHIEEMERMSPQLQNFLKGALDPACPIMPRHLIVTATSNGVGNLDPALLERFMYSFRFDSGGDSLRSRLTERIAELWSQYTNAPMPDVSRWGLYPDGQQLSIRKAMQRLERELEDLQ